MRKAALANCASVMVTFLALSASISTAQQPPAKSLQYEVAVIRPGHPPPGGAVSSSSTGGPGGEVRFINTPLRDWIENGLSVRDYALKAPAWLDTARFDLDARLPANQNASPEMMKALLVERFGLKWHEEMQTVPAYELVQDKKVKIQPSSLLEGLQGHGSSRGPTMIQGNNQPMSELAKALAEALGRPVVDATHLSGEYSFNLRWLPDTDAAVAQDKQNGVNVDALPSTVFTALQEQLGLRLVTARVPSKVIVVDNINRQPVEN